MVILRLEMRCSVYRLLLLLSVVIHCESLQHCINRRDTLRRVSDASAIIAAAATTPALAAEPKGLGARLLQRDPKLLQNRIFSKPPSVQVYPTWMDNKTWRVTSELNGYIFPSSLTNIPKDKIVANTVVPGFQKCSIAATADIGRGVTTYDMLINNGIEDRVSTFKNSIDAYLGYPAVDKVIYDRNPNRVSIDFNNYRTTNAERIELFINSRESEEYNSKDSNSTPTFVCAEYIRQVTFGTGSTVGVPRQVSTNYANFWTWKLQDDNNSLKGNLLTAGYLDPQDAMFFEAGTLPVVIYSHVLSAVVV